IRGFRVEPGEIESVLRSLGGVHECVVIARRDREDDARLVAYLVPAKDALLSAADLRRALKQRLPDYMVPAAFAFLDALPLTPNGKIDRRALPPPEESIESTNTPRSRPLTGLENAIAEIWRSILHVDRLGVHDNFFDLGGHSLLATRMTAELERRTGR